jgi:hypothetical protein
MSGRISPERYYANMILQIGTYSRQVDFRRDSQRCEMRKRPHA